MCSDGCGMPERHWLFLPGASGQRVFWQPLINQLGLTQQAMVMGYPGFDGLARQPEVNGMADLAERVAQQVTAPTVLVAQSMGGILAIMAALARPHLVTHLVLVATSAGVDMASLGATDWVPDYRQAHEAAPDWFCQFKGDLSADLPRLRLPTLLVWGDADPISPVAVGKRLAALLPQAHLEVIQGGQHDLAATHATEVASLVQTFLHTTPDG